MNLQGTLGKRIGPLPAYMWGIAIGGGLLVFFLIRGKSSSAATTPTNDTGSTDPNPTPVDPIAGPPGPAGPSGDIGPIGPRGDTGDTGPRGGGCPPGYHAKWINVAVPGHPRAQGRKTLVCVPNLAPAQNSAKIAGVTSKHDDDLSWAPNMGQPAFTDQQNVPSITHAPFSTYSPQVLLHERIQGKPTAYIGGEPEFVTPIEGMFDEQPLVGKSPPRYPYRINGRPSKVS